MSSKKPTKRQKGIMTLLSLIESEGLHYGLVHYGGDKELAIIQDDKLTDLVHTLRATSNKLEAKIEELQKEVEPFMPDDSDF